MRTNKEDIIRVSKKFAELEPEDLRDIVGFLAVQSSYEGSLTVDELVEKIQNINEHTYNEKDFYKNNIYRGKVPTAFYLIFITMMYWLEINRLDLKKINESFSIFNSRVKKSINAKLKGLSSLEEIEKTLALSPMGQFDSWMSLILVYNPDENSINHAITREYIFEFERNKNRLSTISKEDIDSFVEPLLGIMNITHKDGINRDSCSEITYTDLLDVVKDDSLAKNIIKLLESYPCITMEEISEILINNYSNKTISGYLKKNTIIHENDLTVWDKEQYINDNNAVKMRMGLMNNKSKSYKDLDEINTPLTKEIINLKINELLDKGILLYINPIDEFQPPYIMENHVSTEYIALRTDKILDSLYEKERICSSQYEENFFTQFLR